MIPGYVYGHLSSSGLSKYYQEYLIHYINRTYIDKTPANHAKVHASLLYLHSTPLFCSFIKGGVPLGVASCCEVIEGDAPTIVVVKSAKFGLVVGVASDSSRSVDGEVLSEFPFVVVGDVTESSESDVCNCVAVALNLDQADLTLDGIGAMVRL